MPADENRKNMMNKLDLLIASQRLWIQRCGQDEDGYVKHYGSQNDQERQGRGGEVIFLTDELVLIKLEAVKLTVELSAAVRRKTEEEET